MNRDLSGDLSRDLSGIGDRVWAGVLADRASRALAMLMVGMLALIGNQALAATHVKFEIDMREEINAGRFDPTKDRVSIRGAAPLSWDRPLYAYPAPINAEPNPQSQNAHRGTTGPDDVGGNPGDAGPGSASEASGSAVPGGLWRAELTVENSPFNSALLYKFRIERPGQGSAEGWEPGPNRNLELVADRVLVARAFGAPAAPISISRAGQIDKLPPLGDDRISARTIQVWLPPGYEQHPEQRYPVLYLHDGQNVFDAAAAGAEWGFDETAQRLVADGDIQPLIIVAVSSGPTRVDDFTATRIDRDGIPQGGKAADYARYLIQTVKPAIDQRYRTLKDPGHTAVGGSSLGGILSFWLVLHHDDVFGGALVVSPSLWWDKEFPLRDLIRTPLSGAPRPKLWLDMGTEEGSTAIKQLRTLRATLLNRGWNRNDLNYLEARGGGHDETSWAARVTPMLFFLDRTLWPGKGTPRMPKGSDDPFPPEMPKQIVPMRGAQP
ncbi:alpha/beta hydrolase-fold protein [Roseateles sp. SL47]|uniref:alpha/beta hydrolase n=1 Tax=Roseateles sp. SL47 TaxID=2995138 RepID=UPI00226EF4B7|nr:alpha/beta hydrolase-fold protein [Roseateles sp. SL47]WAC75202.1 alpha/beta hydrolase-fold protein [Roseateles sp. SL47]